MALADRIVVAAHPSELHRSEDGVVDVYAALERQFFWADMVMVTSDATTSPADDGEVLEGEIVL
jgi:hypothetical protein